MLGDDNIRAHLGEVPEVKNDLKDSGQVTGAGNDAPCREDGAGGSRGLTIKVLSKGATKDSKPFEYKEGYTFVSGPGYRDYDWLVVYDEMPAAEEVLACPRAHTILATVEPVSIKDYSRAYTNQFGHLLTNRPFKKGIKARYHLGRGYFRWFIGRGYKSCVQTEIGPKTKLISVACSSKRMKQTMHNARYNLISDIASAIPELEWYGHGVRPFDNKYDVMDPYKYHIAVENHIAPHHWSEKLSDPFLSECLPFYAGDPCVGEILPPESFIPIPIDDPAEATKIIKAAIANDEWTKRREAILEAKKLILGKYNFWAQVIDVIENSRDEGDKNDTASAPGRIFARKALRLRSPAALFEDGYLHALRILGISPAAFTTAKD